MQSIKIKPLSEIAKRDRYERVLFVWAPRGIVEMALHDTLMGVTAAHNYGEKMPMPDGFIEPIEVEE